MKLTLIVLFACFCAVFGQTMMPQCRCNQINSCLQQQQQKMQTCALSNNCVIALGGNPTQVTSCLNQRWARGQPMDMCTTMMMANMGCTNSSNPMQVRSSTNMNMMNQMPTLTGASGAFMTCVQNCMKSGSQQMPSCTQQLGCALDFSSLNMDMAVMGAQTCMMMTISQMGNNPMMNQQNYNPMMNQQNYNPMMNQQNYNPTMNQQNNPMMNQQNSNQAPTLNSMASAFMTCISNMLNQTKNNMMNQQNSNMMNQPNNNMMYQQQNGNMMNQPNNNMMYQQQNGNMMMQPQLSPTMMAGILPQDCQCLVNAGVQMSCGNTQMGR